jgi:tRNA(Ile2) C34 agmatinyltransferase TiaS
LKQKQPRQTVCNEPKDDPKEPYCGGKLKRVTELDAEAKRLAGAGKDAFRCQKCKTLYVEDSPYAVTKGK